MTRINYVIKKDNNKFEFPKQNNIWNKKKKLISLIYLINFIFIDEINIKNVVIILDYLYNIYEVF